MSSTPDSIRRSVITKSSLLLAFIGALVSLFINYYLLDKCYILSDTAWYATLLRDQPLQATTSWFYLLWKSVFGDQIFYYNVTSLAIIYLSIIALTIGVYCLFFNKLKFKYLHYFSILFWTCTMAYYLQRNNPTIIPSYVNMNLISLNFALCFLFIALSRYPKWIMFVLSGVFLGPLTFIMITNIAIYPLVLLLIYIKSKKLINVFYTLTGIALSYILYFLFFLDFSSFYSVILNGFDQSSTNKDEPYGLIYVIQWFFSSLVYISIRYLGGGVLLYIFYTLYLRSKRLITQIGILSLGILFFIAIFVFSGKSLSLSYANNLEIIRYFFNISILQISPLFLAEALFGFSLILILADKKITWVEKLQWLFISSIPLLLSIGSLLNFHTRGTVYICYLAVLPCFLLIRHSSIKLATTILGTLIAIIAGFVYEYDKPNFFHEASCEQNTLVPNQQLYVREEIAVMLNECDKHLKAGDTVLVNKNWGVFFLSDTTCISYDFAATPAKTAYLLQDQYKDLKELTIISFMRYEEIDRKIIEAIRQVRPVDVKVHHIIGRDASDPYSTSLYKLTFE